MPAPTHHTMTRRSDKSSRHRLDQDDQPAFAEMPLEKLAANREYIHLFWRAHLGAVPFALWDTLATLQLNMSAGDAWPPIKTLAALLGPGVTRLTILGRAPSKKHPGQQGALPRLVDEGLVKYSVEGDHPAVYRYVFKVHTILPLLTPLQVRDMVTRGSDHDSHLEALHVDALVRMGVTVYRWNQTRRRSFIQPLV
jgi:hypothetical protein